MRLCRSPIIHSGAFFRAAAVAAASLALASFAAPLPSYAWGGEGHTYIAGLAVRSLPAGPLKSLFEQNRKWFEANSSFPDRWRNRPDNAEAGRHFLDTENFGVGTNVRKVSRAFGEVLKTLDYEKLRTDGVNPWTVRRHYQLLVDALREKRMDDIFVQAAYLSHYIGDAHVPFHASANYDGQLSQPAQKGIHSRFETQALQRGIKAEDLNAGAPTRITDPLEATFTALQDSINEVPGILAADREAVQVSGGEYNGAYWDRFLPGVRPVAMRRLETGGRTLAGFLLAAYQEAGNPKLPSEFVMTDRYLPYAPAFQPRGQPRPPALPPISEDVKAAARKNVRTLSLNSKALGKAAPVNILLPRDYATTKTRYPVLYLLHGATGGHGDWNAQSGIAAYVADLPLIVVMPDANGDSFYLNSPGKGKVEDYFTRELIPAIDRMFRTEARKEKRVIAGLSMGGYGAWRLALNHPNLFTAAASLSGAFVLGEEEVTTNEFIGRIVRGMYNGTLPDASVLAAERLLPRIGKQVNRNRYTGPALYFDIGAEDFLLKRNRDMESALLERGIPYEFAEFRGRHDWAYWDEHVRDVLQFVMRQISTTP